MELNRSNVENVPNIEGVVVVAGSDKKPTMIKGGSDVRAILLEKLESPGEACLFTWEQDGMYSKRESEMIQQHLARYGEMPAGEDDELDDLF